MKIQARIGHKLRFLAIAVILLVGCASCTVAGKEADSDGSISEFSENAEPELFEPDTNDPVKAAANGFDRESLSILITSVRALSDAPHRGAGGFRTSDTVVASSGLAMRSSVAPEIVLTVSRPDPERGDPALLSLTLVIPSGSGKQTTMRAGYDVTGEGVLAAGVKLDLDDVITSESSSNISPRGIDISVGIGGLSNEGQASGEPIASMSRDPGDLYYSFSDLSKQDEPQAPASVSRIEETTAFTRAFSENFFSLIDFLRSENSSEFTDGAQFSRCTPKCILTGVIPIRSGGYWITLATEPASYGGMIVARIDSNSRVAWKFETAMWETLYPALPGFDRSGNVFFFYDAGNYRGLIVLRETASTIESFGSLPNRADEAFGRFVGVDLLLRGTSPIAIRTRFSNCDPSCGEGRQIDQTYEWSGSDYSLE